MHVWKILVAGLIISSLMFAACGGDDDDVSPEEAQANLCESLNTLQGDLAALTDLSADSTVSDLQSAQESVQEAYADVESAAQEVDDAEVAELQTAVDDLESAVEDISDDETIAAALASIAPQLAAVESAWDDLFTFGGCSQ